MVTAAGFLAKRRLSVPDDVSLILLNEQAEPDWFPGHFWLFSHRSARA